jgi:hypothetical protein
MKSEHFLTTYLQLSFSLINYFLVNQIVFFRFKSRSDHSAELEGFMGVPCGLSRTREAGKQIQIKLTKLGKTREFKVKL